ncbi:MAG TPA: hypothetical protein VF841_06685 [Anaeromyxobacter sp.]
MPTPRRARATRGRVLFALQLFLLGVVAANAAWFTADGLKRLPALRSSTPVFEWVRLFRHPDDAAILPYLAAALAAFGWGLFLYVRLRPPAPRLARRLRRTALARSPALLLAVAAVQALIVSSALPRPLRMILAGVSVAACAVPRLPRLAHGHPLGRLARAAAGRSWRPAATVLAVAATAALLVAVSVEPVRLALGPVRLLNEYPALPERPAERDGVEAGAAASADRCAFVAANPLETAFQDMSRGQLNHIGHVLNPLNEYATGKPLADTYFQYGVGATFAFGWVMDRFGGLSLQAYYRSLLLFVAYALVFVAAAAVLLRDARYVLAATGLLAAAHYGIGYQALLLAPGINPILHFLDLLVLLATLPFFRGGRPAPLALALAGAAAALAVNPLFGAATAAALVVSAATFLVENAPAGRRALRLAVLGAAAALALGAVGLAIPRTAGLGISAQFLQGFFSWRPSPVLVLSTLGYLAGSYLFLLWARDARDPSKYAVVYLFVYVQGFLVYAYWSGLGNHFWPALPYLGLHLLLMLRMLARAPWAARSEPAALAAILLVAGVAVWNGAESFAGERAAVDEVFSRWENHAWTFPRARVVATADPAPIAATLAQLGRYSSADDRALPIISVLDNLIPFLAGRHSIFPHFDSQWALLDERERRRWIETAAAARPRYLFVGREVEAEPPPREELVCGERARGEAQAAQGRIDGLRQVFEALSGRYERVETGPLLSVYRRSDRADDAPGRPRQTLFRVRDQ